MRITVEINDEIFNDLKDAATFCNENHEDMLHKIIVKGIFGETIKTNILKKHLQSVQSASLN